MPKITPFLWFDTQAEEAAEFYTSIFKESRIVDVTLYGPARPGPSGSVMVVHFQLNGQDFLALNGARPTTRSMSPPHSSSTAVPRTRWTTSGAGLPKEARRAPAVG